jgi:hypothetical protein
MAPAPNRFHQDISRNLEFLLLKYLEEHPVGVLYYAPFEAAGRDFCGLAQQGNGKTHKGGDGSRHQDA